MSNSPLERRFFRDWQLLYPNIELIPEYKGIEGRRFQFDFAEPKSKVAIEIQGGIYNRKSAHSSVTGLERDYEKINLAQAQGWRVFQLSAKMITPKWITIIGEAINAQK
jgi:very-short-patch-repair endonuclease